MKQSAIIQRIVVLPQYRTDHLARVGDGYVWTADESIAAHVFEDFLFDPNCQAGGKCTLHAECVSRVLGGYPVRTSVIREIAKGNAAKEHTSRAPEEVFEDLAKRGLA